MERRLPDPTDFWLCIHTTLRNLLLAIRSEMQKVHDKLFTASLCSMVRRITASVAILIFILLKPLWTISYLWLLKLDSPPFPLPKALSSHTHRSTTSNTTTNHSATGQGNPRRKSNQLFLCFWMLLLMFKLQLFIDESDSTILTDWHDKYCNRHSADCIKQLCKLPALTTWLLILLLIFTSCDCGVSMPKPITGTPHDNIPLFFFQSLCTAQRLSEGTPQWARCMEHLVGNRTGTWQLLRKGSLPKPPFGLGL